MSQTVMLVSSAAVPASAPRDEEPLCSDLSFTDMNDNPQGTVDASVNLIQKH